LNAAFIDTDGKIFSRSKRLLHDILRIHVLQCSDVENQVATQQHAASAGLKLQGLLASTAASTAPTAALKPARRVLAPVAP